MKFETVKITIFVPKLLKQTHPMQHLEPMVLIWYSDTDICALLHLEKYREVTISIRKSNKLLLSFVKPHKPISTSTLASWCVSTHQQAGADITVFGSHSTRVVSTSHCQRKGLSIKQINKLSVQTFARRNIFQKLYLKCKFGEYSLRMLNICTSKCKVSFLTFFYTIC